MRIPLMMGLLAIAWPAGAMAQPGKYSAVVILPEIELRAGPSWRFPAAGKLKKDEQVIVHHEDGLWAAILPPPGSQSWVNHRFLGEFDPHATVKQNALIMADNTEVRIGSDKGLPLTVTQVKLPKGTWVEIDGAKKQDENSFWYPITPPEGEYRWLPKEALGTPSPLAPPPVFVKNAGPSPGDPPSNAPTPVSLTSNGSKPAPAAPDARWDKAEQAERSGDYATAEKFYTLVYQDLRQKNSDPELLLVCYNRIIRCQDRQRLNATATRTPLTPPPLAPGARAPASLQAPTTASSGASGAAWPPEPRPASSRTTGAGNLRRAGFFIGEKQAYAFEDANGQLLYYVTAGKNVGLDAYVNRRVELTGNVQVRGDIRGGEYMIVSDVTAIK